VDKPGALLRWALSRLPPTEAQVDTVLAAMLVLNPL
jgi:hypothetical protein